MPAPRILHVLNGEHFSGAERVQDLLAQRLPDFGFEVGMASLKPGRFDEARRSTAPLEHLHMRSRWDFSAVTRLAQLVRDDGYDLLHAHTPRSVMVASLAAGKTGTPLVYHVHSPTSRDSTRRVANFVNHHVERLGLLRAKQLLTVSPTLTDHMVSVGYPAERITCVPNGVPVVDGAAPRPRPDRGLTLGMVALFRPRKGAEVLLEAIALLRSLGHDVRLRAIGPFETIEYEEQLTGLARRLEVSDAIHWTGFTTDVAAELGRVDALALPSLFGEGLPMVVLEAMAAGLPVVATRCEGVSQAVVHRETGLLVEAGSVSQLSQAVEELVRGDVDYHAMSDASITRHGQQFSDSVMAGRVADVYRQVLGLPRVADHTRDAEPSSTEELLAGV